MTKFIEVKYKGHYTLVNIDNIITNNMKIMK